MKISVKQPLSGLLIPILCGGLATAHSNEITETTLLRDAEGNILIPEVRVNASSTSEMTPTQAEGSWTLSAEHLRVHGKSDGNLTPMLEALPNVHFDNSRRSSDSLYNLAPPSVSISGGRSYENNFMLDGFSINSRFDPGHNGSVAADLPGHDQAMFVDTELLGNVQVFQSNVPARYGRFLGGVIDAQTRSYSEKPKTILSYRYTGGELVESRVYRISETDETSEPDFRRDRLSVIHTRALNEQSGLVLAFTRSSSSIPVTTADITEHAKQESYNFLAKYQRAFDSGLNADIAVNVMPHSSTNYFPSYRHSEYTVNGGGLGLNGKFNWLTQNGHEMNVDIGYSWKTSNREAPDHTYAWIATASKPWGMAVGSSISYEGGVGDLNKDDHGASIQWIGKVFLKESEALAVSYEYGAEVIGSLVSYERPQTTINYMNALLTPGIQCRGSFADCLHNEQYFTTRNVYEADDVSVSLIETAAFFELTGEWSRFKLTAGVRSDYNDYTQNIDFAPRSRFSLDIFGNKKTLFIGGLNRYYGGSLLTYKLREARAPYYQEYRSAHQNIVGNWERTSQQGASLYRSNDLSTPYSDEVVLGFRQTLWGGVASLDFIYRDNHQQFSASETGTQADGYKIKSINNNGSGSYRSASLSWAGELFWQIHSTWMLSWSKAKTSNEDYDDAAKDNESYTHAWYRDQRYAIGELDILRSNFSRPVIATIKLHRQFSDVLLASATVRYESSYPRIYDSGQIVRVAGNTPEIPFETLPVYLDRRHPQIVMLDMTAELTPWPRYPLTFTVDVINAANARTHLVQPDTRGVEIGRQLWLGVKYEF